MTLPEFSLRQPVLVNVLFFVCLLGGMAAFSRTPIEYYPDVTLNQLWIGTYWTGASADEVERLVTQKLEEELGAVTDIDELRSTSQSGFSEILIELDEMLDEQEYESAINDVRAAIDRVEDLPEDAEEPLLQEILAQAPVVSVALVDVGGVGPTALRELARDAGRRIEQLAGVKSSDRRGAQEREIRILVDRDAASRYGLGVQEVAARVRRHNLNLSAGTFASEAGETTVRAQGDYESVDEILDTVVLENPNGTLVRLREVARIEEGLEKRRYASRFNGKPAQLLTVMKEDDQDAIELVARVDVWLAAYRELLPPGVEIHKALDTAAFVQPQMQTLVENLLLGIFLVIAILWFTIGFRNAALTSIAIPFSFLTAMIFFPVLGISINSSTLIGMLLVSGMLVDDAIIVLENIYRKVEEGLPLRKAILDGSHEVMWPVIAAVTTTCAAFAPLLLVGGTAGKFVSILPKCVLVCLIASLFECLVILPAHYLDFGSRRKPEGEGPELTGFGARTHRIRAAVEGGIGSVRGAYARALVPVLEHKVAFTALLVGLVFFSWGYSQNLEVELFPGEFDTFNVLLESPPDFSLDQTEAVTLALDEPLLESLGESIDVISTVVGASVDSNYDVLSGPNLAMSYLVIERTEETAKAPEKVMQAVKARVDAWAEQNPDGIVDLRVVAQQDGPPVGAPVEMRILGSEYAIGKSIAREVIAYLETVPGVFNIEDNLKEGPGEARLVVDAQRAARHGLSFEDIALALRSANDGVVATTFRSPAIDEDIDIRVLLEERYRGSLADILDVELATPAGYRVKLRDVADVEITRGYLAYRRFNERRTVTVSAEVDNELATSRSVNQRLQARFADIEARYPGVEVQFGGEFQSQSEAFADLGRAFPIAFLAIYMILAALFRSYLQPLVVIASIPFGLMGVVFGVGLLGYKVSFILMYATIGLTGVVVNDALVMVDFINRAREEGKPLRQAVQESGVIRFRPILLTTLTTVMALLPMALGFGGQSKTYGPFAASISFGLIFAMAGTLFAVPLAYTALIEMREKALGWIARIRGRRGPRDAPDYSST